MSVGGFREWSVGHAFDEPLLRAALEEFARSRDAVFAINSCNRKARAKPGLAAPLVIQWTYAMHQGFGAL
jgi:hypothetical protein